MEKNKTNDNAKGNEDNQQKTGVKDQDIHGRLYNSKNPAFKNKDSIDDISHFDEQEGTMNRGTTGGKGV